MVHRAAGAIVLLLATLLLQGCLSPVESIDEGQLDVLEAEAGYLLIAVDTNFNLDQIKLGGRKYLSLNRDDLQHGTNFILARVPAGKYRIISVHLNFLYAFKLDDENWRFEVTPGVVSYVGHLNVQNRLRNMTARIELENRSSEALEFLESNFPHLIDSEEVRYAGPGEDDFFLYVRSLERGAGE
ncbi:hypothetical protein AUP74_00429 [Microbulbifer aggregans]|uniref:Uncharacterized protein n=1 Tax=Microbulbifer aggregans TaxID=1769779 RepID=A0A1C9W443_9GAMM|nr:hypothetical protein [Microbulbifer aggregans]AOS95900.1 hypothetical protein AUP74_00429 [Microbulbifer aggregans]